MYEHYSQSIFNLTCFNRDQNVDTLRACLHGGGGPQVGEVTRLGEVKK